jgi:RNA polymerase sigma-70 factor (ECF subfamily)
MAHTTAAAEAGKSRLERDVAGILARHGRWLRTIVFARLREPQAVEEVLQEVAVALVKGRSLPEDESAIAPWLYRVAVRQTLLYRRKLGRRRKLHDCVAEALPPLDHDPRSPDPLAWLLADERRKLVRIALARLAPRDAEMLLLKYTEDWNYGQIADHLGISHAAVESRLHRARARLRQELAALNVIEPSLSGRSR